MGDFRINNIPLQYYNYLYEKILASFSKISKNFIC